MVQQVSFGSFLYMPKIDPNDIASEKIRQKIKKFKVSLIFFVVIFLA